MVKVEYIQAEAALVTTRVFTVKTVKRLLQP